MPISFLLLMHNKEEEEDEEEEVDEDALLSYEQILAKVLYTLCYRPLPIKPSSSISLLPI
jgi:hypothetical protein